MSKVQTDLYKVNERSIASLITKNDAIVKKSCEIRKSRTTTQATFIVYNSIMAGCGLSVN